MDITNYKAYGQKIIFQFVDKASAKGFSNTTDWNFEVKSHDDNAKRPRWGKVIVVGNDVPDHIQPDTYVLIEHLMWTHGMEVESEKYWATDYAKVIGTLAEKPTGTY